MALTPAARRRAGRAAVAALAGAGGVAVPPPSMGFTRPVLEQEPERATLSWAVLDADVEPGESAHVHLTYELSVPAGTGSVPLTVLAPEPARIANLQARVQGAPATVSLPPSATAQRGGAVALVPRVEGAVRLELDYRVDGAVAGDAADRLVRIPILAVDWPPGDPLPGTFTARVRLPPDWVAYEAFPTAMGGLARAGTDPGPSVLELSVLPAYVTLRARLGSAPLLTVPRVADALVLLVFLGLGVVGWRKMRDAL